MFNSRNIRISVQPKYFGRVHSRKRYNSLTELINTIHFGNLVSFEEVEFLFEHIVAEPNLVYNEWYNGL